MDVLLKDIHTPETSKPAEAILRLNQLFDIESELRELSPDQKKKNVSSARKRFSRLFGHGQRKMPWESCEIQTFERFSLRVEEL